MWRDCSHSLSHATLQASLNFKNSCMRNKTATYKLEWISVFAISVKWPIRSAYTNISPLLSGQQIYYHVEILKTEEQTKKPFNIIKHTTQHKSRLSFTRRHWNLFLKAFHQTLLRSHSHWVKLTLKQCNWKREGGKHKKSHQPFYPTNVKTSHYSGIKFDSTPDNPVTCRMIFTHFRERPAALYVYYTITCGSSCDSHAEITAQTEPMKTEIKGPENEGAVI